MFTIVDDQLFCSSGITTVCMKGNLNVTYLEDRMYGFYLMVQQYN